MRFSKKQTKFLIIIFGILFLLSLNFFQKEVKNFFYSISSPFQKKLWIGGREAAGFLKTIFEIKALKEENEALRLKNQELLVKNLALKELEKENEVLRKALEIGLEKEFKVNLAQVIGKDISQDLLIIDKGLMDGVSIDLPVITEEKVLIGKISEVYKNHSKVMLLTAKNFSFDAKIAEKEIYGIARGKGNFRLSLELLPVDKEIKEGEIVVTAILGGIFPRNLLVGKIEKVQKSDIEPFQKAEVEPAFEIGDLKYLFIIEKW